MNAPSRRDRARPAELLALSAAIAGFVGLVVFMSTRDLGFATITLGVTFILSLVTIAMLAISTKPDSEERREIDNHDERHQGFGGH